jgi:ComF family protein
MGRQYIDPPLPASASLVLTRWLPSSSWLALLPTQCAICHGWHRERVCGPCQRRFVVPGPRCQRCALRVPNGVQVCGGCLRHPPPYDSALAALDYGHPWDHLITRFKFNAALDLADALAQSLVDAWHASGLPHPGLLLPAPLSSARLRERGYNQSWEIARRVARRLACPCDARLLLRIRDTPHQLSIPVEHRAANVQGAYAVEPTRMAQLRGRSVTVVDDVMTTGATAAEMTRALRQAGASQVHLWVVARTAAPGD